MTGNQMLDLETLACHVLGLEEGADSEALDAAVYERFEIDLTQFMVVAQALLPFTPTVQTTIIKHAFVKDGYIICSELKQ